MSTGIFIAGGETPLGSIVSSVGGYHGLYVTNTVTDEQYLVFVRQWRVPTKQKQRL